MSVTTNSSQFCRRLFQVSVVGLPYFSYASLVGLVITLVALLARFQRSALDLFSRNLLLLISGLMGVSCLFAVNRGEALLQLANFLPFFLLFSVLPYVLKGTERLERLAMAVVLATIPINLVAFVEYLLRAPFVPRTMRRIPFVRWVRARPHAGRAMVMFDHPNWLASYLVLVLGLGLGLILYHTLRQPPAAAPAKRIPARLWLLYIGTFLNLLGIFSSGSRNGLIVAASQLVLFSLCTRASRLIMAAGVVSLLGLGVGAAWLGVGGRSIATIDWANDPRVAVWNFALGLIQERPWLGWGLGNYKFQYPPGLIPDYDYIGHPHNVWLLLAVEAGIPVMLLVTLWVGSICASSVRSLVLGQLKPQEQAILLAYLFSFWGCIAFALFDVTLYDARVNVMDWVVLGGIYTIGRSATPPVSD